MIWAGLAGAWEGGEAGGAPAAPAPAPGGGIVLTVYDLAYDP